jgi:integrase
MKPSIRFELKDNIVYVKIGVNGAPAEPFSLGVTIEKDFWDQRKQICGDPTKQSFLITTKDTLEKTFLPGMTAQALWLKYRSSLEDANSHTIKVAIDYILAHKKMKKNTKQPYYQIMKRAVKYGFENQSVLTLNAAMIRKFLGRIKEEVTKKKEPIQEGSVYLYYSALISAVSYYIKDHGLKTENNIDAIMQAPNIDRGKLSYSIESYCTIPDLMELLEIDLSDDKSLFSARQYFIDQCFTGMSMIDLEAIQDVHKQISVDQQGTKWLTYNRGKNGHKCEIPLNNISEEYLTKSPWPMEYGRRQYQYLVEKLGDMIGKRLTPHVGRHSFGVIMLEAGYSLEAVSRMMGHTSIKITEQCYAKITRKRIENEHLRVRESINSIAHTFLNN